MNYVRTGPFDPPFKGPRDYEERQATGEPDEPEDEEPETVSERDEDDPYPDRVMVDASGKPHYEP